MISRKPAPSRIRIVGVLRTASATYPNGAKHSSAPASDGFASGILRKYAWSRGDYLGRMSLVFKLQREAGKRSTAGAPGRDSTVRGREIRTLRTERVSTTVTIRTTKSETAIWKERVAMWPGASETRERLTPVRPSGIRETAAIVLDAKVAVPFANGQTTTAANDKQVRAAGVAINASGTTGSRHKAVGSRSGVVRQALVWGRGASASGSALAAGTVNIRSNGVILSHPARIARRLVRTVGEETFPAKRSFSEMSGRSEGRVKRHDIENRVGYSAFASRLLGGGSAFPALQFPGRSGRGAEAIRLRYKEGEAAANGALSPYRKNSLSPVNRRGGPHDTIGRGRREEKTVSTAGPPQQIRPRAVLGPNAAALSVAASAGRMPPPVSADGFRSAFRYIPTGGVLAAIIWTNGRHGTPVEVPLHRQLGRAGFVYRIGPDTDANPVSDESLTIALAAERSAERLRVDRPRPPTGSSPHQEGGGLVRTPFRQPQPVLRRSAINPYEVQRPKLAAAALRRERLLPPYPARSDEIRSAPVAANRLAASPLERSRPAMAARMHGFELIGATMSGDRYRSAVRLPEPIILSGRYPFPGKPKEGVPGVATGMTAPAPSLVPGLNERLASAAATAVPFIWRGAVASHAGSPNWANGDNGLPAGKRSVSASAAVQPIAPGAPILRRTVRPNRRAEIDGLSFVDMLPTPLTLPDRRSIIEFAKRRTIPSRFAEKIVRADRAGLIRSFEREMAFEGDVSGFPPDRWDGAKHTELLAVSRLGFPYAFFDRIMTGGFGGAAAFANRLGPKVPGPRSWVRPLRPKPEAIRGVERGLPRISTVRRSIAAGAAVTVRYEPKRIGRAPAGTAIGAVGTTERRLTGAAAVGQLGADRLPLLIRHSAVQGIMRETAREALFFEEARGANTFRLPSRRIGMPPGEPVFARAASGERADRDEPHSPKRRSGTRIPDHRILARRAERFSAGSPLASTEAHRAAPIAQSKLPSRHPLDGGPARQTGVPGSRDGRTGQSRERAAAERRSAAPTAIGVAFRRVALAQPPAGRIAADAPYPAYARKAEQLPRNVPDRPAHVADMARRAVGGRNAPDELPYAAPVAANAHIVRMPGETNRRPEREPFVRRPNITAQPRLASPRQPPADGLTITSARTPVSRLHRRFTEPPTPIRPFGTRPVAIAASTPPSANRVASGSKAQRTSFPAAYGAAGTRASRPSPIRDRAQGGSAAETVSTAVTALRSSAFVPLAAGSPDTVVFGRHEGSAKRLVMANDGARMTVSRSSHRLTVERETIRAAAPAMRLQRATASPSAAGDGMRRTGSAPSGGPPLAGRPDSRSASPARLAEAAERWPRAPRPAGSPAPSEAAPSSLEHKRRGASPDGGLATEPVELDYRRPSGPPSASSPPAPQPEPPQIDADELYEMIKKLPQFDVKKIADRVYREIERKMRFDRQTRGL